MRRQDHYGMTSKHACLGDENENGHSGNTKPHNQDEAQISHADTLYEPTTNTTDSTATAPVFKFSAPTPARNPFTFQQRARESTATSQVSSRISSNRDTRKAGFIDRLRRSRHDERDARGLDSFEKAEYWRERRERDLRLRREAASYDIDVEAEMSNLEYDDEEAELSPVDDDGEVDDLVDAFYDHHHQSRSRFDDELMSDDFGMDEEEDYAEAFLEVLSQEQRGLNHHGTAANPMQSGSTGNLVTPRNDSLEGDMDVS